MSNLVTAQTVAELLSVTTATLSAWRRAGRGPAYVKLSNGPRGKVRYRLSDVQAYVERQLECAAGERVRRETLRDGSDVG